ncbi:IAA-alanine resistance protein 1 [Camellia lanceoleosa]|uniref:IAA-alanine resistance protein 1 n=1 Tax=Camellia lanceoleosa TaxID=1840588 RepID=A0ACC0G269_9ERIC|nr:IAA-alanine resistance protein 1 [Camellia lanceoleosa]
MGQDQGQSSLIGVKKSSRNDPSKLILTLRAGSWLAGGFVYIAVAKVLAEMNNGSSSAIKSTVLQLTSLISGMAVTLCISLVE